MMGVKLLVLRVRVPLVVPPHCWDSSVRHHPVPPQAEGAPGAAACLQRRKLNERARAQLEQQEDADKGSENGHAAEHSDGDGKLGGRLERRLSIRLSRHEVTRGFPHVLVEVHAGAGERVQGAVRWARQTRLGAEAAAREAGRWARQAGGDGGWCYGVAHGVGDGLAAHRKARWTFFYTALLKEVVPRVALCKRKSKQVNTQIENATEKQGRELRQMKLTKTKSVSRKTAVK